MNQFPGDGETLYEADRPGVASDWQPAGDVPPDAAVAVMQQVIDGLHARDPRDAVIEAARQLASLVPPPLRIDTDAHLAEDTAYYDARGILLDRLNGLRGVA